MKKFLIILLLLFISFQSVYSEGKRNVAVYPLANPTGEKWISNLGQSVTDTVILSLALMGKFKIETPDMIPANFDMKNLSSIAESNGFDNIIFGDCKVTDDGYKVGVSIYDFSKDGITDTSEEEFYSLLDSFDAADNIVDVVVENLSGEKVYFGSLFVNPTRSEKYRTEINGNDVGFGFTGSDKVVTGLHEFQFFQERTNGEELIGSEKIEVKLRKSSKIKLNIPWLTNEEALSYRKIRNSIMKNYMNGLVAEKSSFLINEAAALNENTFISKYRNTVKDEYTELDNVIKSPQISYSNYKHSI
jgi:TolB-like protein